LPAWPTAAAKNPLTMYAGTRTDPNSLKRAHARRSASPVVHGCGCPAGEAAADAVAPGGAYGFWFTRTVYSRFPVRENFVFDGPGAPSATTGSGAKSCGCTDGAGTACGDGVKGSAPLASRQHRNPTK